MKRLIIIVVGGLTAITGPTIAISQERCVGITPQHHPLGLYDFSTNSRVEQDGQFSKYFACVENNSKDNWLRFSWFIPLIGDRWVPPGEFVEQYRLSSDASARPIIGCIQYGNLQSKVIAQLLGDAKDEQKSANPNEVECRRSLGFDDAPPSKAVELPSDGVWEESRLFVPSDLSDPVNSMVQVNVAYGIKPSAEGYTSFFVYSASPYKGSSKANPELIRLRPRFTPETKGLYKAFSEQVTPDFLPISKDGSSFTFSVAGAKQWMIEPVFYDFVDKDGNILTSLHVPLFAPAVAH